MNVNRRYETRVQVRLTLRLDRLKSLCINSGSY